MNLVRLTLGELRERVNNNDHSRGIYHPQCYAVMPLVQKKKYIHSLVAVMSGNLLTTEVQKSSLSDSFSVSVFLIHLIGLCREVYMCIHSLA